VSVRETGRPAAKRSDAQTALERLQRQARDNERIWAGFRCVELRIIGAHTLRELVAGLVETLPQKFPSVDCVSLACVDPEYEMSRLIEQNGAVPLATHAFTILSDTDLERLLQRSHRPRLGLCTPALQQLLFPGYPSTVRSLASVPLVLDDRVIGCLNQGSHDPAHFTPTTATDLLDHLALVTAMCVDNALSHERLKLVGFTDALTRIANRREFERRLAEEVERWARRDDPLSCILVDIDHFKTINDRFGHQVGDRTLQRVAELFKLDRRATDVLARYGGEEFVLLLPGTGPDAAFSIAERQRAKLAAYPFPAADGRTMSVTASFGVSCLQAGAMPAETDEGAWLVHEADAALYRAKREGRNRVAAAPQRHWESAE
jgi:two-component system, cell cycle response regulator